MHNDIPYRPKNPLFRIPTSSIIIYLLGFATPPLITSAQIPLEIEMGSNQTLILKSDNSLWGFGENSIRKLGGFGNPIDSPVRIADGVTSISASGTNSLFVRRDGSLWGLGDNSLNQLLTDVVFPDRPILMLGGVSSAAAGDFFVMIIRTDGTLLGLGSNQQGQLGDGTQVNRTQPVFVSSNVKSVAAGGNHTAFIKTDGTLWTAGNNSFGQLGDGTTQTRPRPLSVATNVESVWVSNTHTIFLRKDQTLWGIGHNGSGALGDGTTTNRSMPVKIADDVITAAAGRFCTLFIRSDFSLWATGGEHSTLTPVRIGDNFYKVSASRCFNGYQFAPQIGTYYVAVRRDGIVLAAGSNANNQLSTTLRQGPIPRWLRKTSEVSNALANLSVRTSLPAGQKLIVGTVVNGGPKSLLVRAAGPALNLFGLTGMPDPKLELFTTGSLPIAFNDNWQFDLSAAFSSVGAFPFTRGSLDSALTWAVNGPFTAQASGGTGGSILVEAYDFTGGNNSRMINVSARNRVGTGDDVLIAGFSVSGSGTKEILIRAVGPGLSAFGVQGVLSDPKVELYDSNRRLIAVNDNYLSNLSDVFQKVGAFPLPSGSRDAAILTTVSAGASYTVQVSGVANTTGEALIEVYEVL